MTIITINIYDDFRCGYATIHDVTKKDYEDRMESFFLSETCKYLYLVSIWSFTGQAVNSKRKWNVKKIDFCSSLEYTVVIDNMKVE